MALLESFGSYPDFLPSSESTYHIKNYWFKVVSKHLSLEGVRVELFWVSGRDEFLLLGFGSGRATPEIKNFVWVGFGSCWVRFWVN